MWKEIFIHPRDAFGVLVQLAEFTSDDWLSPSVRMPGHEKVILEKQADGVGLKFAHPGGGTAHIALSREEARKLLTDLQDALG